MTLPRVLGAAGSWLDENHCTFWAATLVLDVAVVVALVGADIPYADYAAVGAVLSLVALVFRAGRRADRHRAASRWPNKRLVIDLAPELYDELEHLAADQHYAITDLVRQAMALLQYVIAHHDSELLTRAAPDDIVIQLTLAGGLEQAGCLHSEAARLADPDRGVPEKQVTNPTQQT